MGAAQTGHPTRMDLYIFGAGASAAEGAPATKDLFRRAWVLLGPSFDEKLMGVWRFLTEIFGIEIAGPDSFAYIPAVDEVVSLVDWSLHVNQGLGPRYDPPRLYHVRRDLEHLICAVLEAALDQARCRTGPHARFVRERLSQPEPNRFAILSLNYDTLLDAAMLEAGVCPDYGLKSPDPAPGPERPLLAKLHGSLNWARCPACGQIVVDEERIAHRLPYVKGLACTRCGNDRLHGLIIPPTWLKSYDGTAGLQHMWDRALAAVQQASRIIFVGYSMPPADLAIYHLIRRGLLVRTSASRPAIEVINHQHAHTEEDEAVIRRFTSLFGPGVRFDFTGFHGQV